MRFFQTLISASALVAAGLAVTIDQYPTGGVVAGQTYTITYSPAGNTPTTFILRQGLSTNLGTIGTLTTTATGGSFSWTVDASLPNQSDYALQVKQGDDTNYSAQFGLTGGSAAAISSAVSSAAASASSAASSVAASASSAASSVRASASSAAASAASSASAALSSAIASAVSSVSATISPSAGLNSTVTSATLSSTATSKASATKSTSIPQSTGAASSLAGSPLAAIFGVVAAFAYLA